MCGPANPLVSSIAVTPVGSLSLPNTIPLISLSQIRDRMDRMVPELVVAATEFEGSSSSSSETVFASPHVSPVTPGARAARSLLSQTTLVERRMEFRRRIYAWVQQWFQVGWRELIDRLVVEV